MTSLKKIVLISALALTLPMAIAAKTTKKETTSKDEMLDGVAAIVNDSIITESEVAEKVDTIKHQLTMAHKDIPSDQDMRKKILNAMINQKVQLEVADRADIQVDLEELNHALENLAKQNHVTMKEMRAQIEAEGLSYAKFRKEMKNQIRIQKLQQGAVGSKVTVTDKEVEAMQAKMQNANSNTQYHLANILISLPEAPTTQQVQSATQKADRIMKQLKAGEKFSKIAHKDSDGDQSLEGGDLGWRKLAEIPDIFTDKLKKMHKGDVEGPIRAPNGLHIIKLIDLRSDNSNLPDKKRIKAMIYNRKMNEKVGEWVQEMRDSAYVKITA